MLLEAANLDLILISINIGPQLIKKAYLYNFEDLNYISNKMLHKIK